MEYFHYKLNFDSLYITIVKYSISYDIFDPFV